MVTQPPKKLLEEVFSKPGKRYGNFIVKKVHEVEEIRCTVVELEHEPTGAEVMHIAYDDPENLFCLSFKTHPKKSDGVAHILEHTVLCGSKKFPVKDPFFSMNRRSLNTYMNALTGADFTCYPAATQVEKDFYNLLDVYIDAVFYPNLNPLSFKQEGHRLEFSSPEDPSSPLEFKGIVFNEMKGVMADAESRLWEEICSRLFPDVIYGINSGGDPKVIPELTHEQLVHFHQTYYHPSRCLFFFFGDMPLTKHLDFLEERLLKDVKKQPPLPPLQKQKRFSRPPESIVLPYPLPEQEDSAEKAMIGMAHLTCPIQDQKTLLSLAVIEIILMGNDASPLKKALLKSGLCKQVLTYMDDDIQEIPICLIFKGCRKENALQLEQLTRATLEQLIETGISERAIESALHQLEFHRSEIAAGSSPYGLALFMRSGLLKQHGVPPEAGLRIHALFDELRESLKDPEYLKNLIRRYYLDNPHYVRITMEPDAEMESRESAEELGKLAHFKEKLTSSQIETIIEETKELADFQKRQEDQDLEILPKVTLADVPRSSKHYHLNQESYKQGQVFSHECFTNRILYLDLLCDLPAIPVEDLPYLTLFTTFLTQMGCGGKSYSDTLEYLQEFTGGVGSSTAFFTQAEDPNLFKTSFHIRGKALYRNVDKTLKILSDFLSSPHFTDKERLKELLTKHYTALHSNLNRSALKYALNLSSAAINTAGRIGYSMHGLEYYWKIRDIVKNIDQELPKLTEKLVQMKDQIITFSNPHLVLCCDGEMLSHLKKANYYGLLDHSNKKALNNIWSTQYPLLKIEPQGRTISSQVAFTAQVFTTLPYTHAETPALAVLSNLFDNKTLHPLIREKGGAYGGGSTCSALGGNFYFYSYRDPNIADTLDAFQHSIQRVLDRNFSDQDLEEAKLEVIQNIDSPVSPGSRALVAYEWMRQNRPDKVRQTFRQHLLDVTKEQAIQAAQKQILPKFSKGTVVTFAGQELIERENKKLAKRGKQTLEILTV